MKNTQNSFLGAQLLEFVQQKKNNILADLFVKYKFFQKTFTSNVKYESNKLIIDVFYIEGPLKSLRTHWKFEKIEEEITKIHFKIGFEFKNMVYQKLLVKFFTIYENGGHPFSM